MEKQLLAKRRKIFPGLRILVLVFLLTGLDLNAETGGTDEKFVADFLTQNGEWYVFSSEEGTRFKVLDKYDYDAARKGMFYKGAELKNKFYLMSEERVVYEPVWEDSYDIKQYVVPAKQYFTKLTKETQKCKSELDESFRKVQAAQENLRKLRDAWIALGRKKTAGGHPSKNSSGEEIKEAKKEYKNAQKELKSLQDEHKKIAAGCQAADTEYSNFCARYAQLIPAAAVDMEPERRELAALIKELPLKKIKYILEQMKQSESRAGN